LNFAAFAAPAGAVPSGMRSDPGGVPGVARGVPSGATGDFAFPDETVGRFA
jgi:hypothetical protein